MRIYAANYARWITQRPEWKCQKSEETFHQVTSRGQSSVRLYSLEAVSWHVTSATRLLPTIH